MSGLIVVGVDGSPTAQKAAQTAATLAAGIGARLHVICAYDRDRVAEVVGTGTDRWMLSTADEAAATAREVVRSLDVDGVEVTSAAATGKPGEALVGEAERHKATLIVVGNKRVQGITRVLGSIATTVAQHAPCDVYIAKTV
ncbi:universal stress protein [Nocardioides sp. Soil796]|uniref:universal stress protein n=1 Tax=Nocardioides sp. Soil796 TaxID=1736412 RepID=UPI00070F8F46|nr:universal stress protein [Nocardioides sp. Soil796]KRF10479.1 universal stress protein UspA [Nocardioides sp. Soil796]